MNFVLFIKISVLHACKKNLMSNNVVLRQTLFLLVIRTLLIFRKKKVKTKNITRFISTNHVMFRLKCVTLHYSKRKKEIKNKINIREPIN
jgi:hypothetical protein